MSDESNIFLNHIMDHYDSFGKIQKETGNIGFPGIALRSYVIDTRKRLTDKIMRCTDFEQLEFNWGDVDATSYGTRLALMNHMNRWRGSFEAKKLIERKGEG